MKFTFKTEKPTGKYISFYNDHHLIKFKRIKVDYFSNEPFYKINLKVIKKDIDEDGNPNCKWKWITLKKESESLQEAKDYLNQNIDKILEKYELVNEE